MKKAFAAILGVFAFVALTACGSPELGDYKPGLHLGYTEGHENTYAYVYVDADGYIFDIFIDTIYMKTDEDGPASWEGRNGEVSGIATTKMSLNYGQGYDMRNDGLWWHEQVTAIAGDIVENQGIADYTIEDGYFDQDADDAIAGVTITVTGYLEAVGIALERAELGEDESPRDFDVPEYEGADLAPGIHFGYTDGHQNTLGFIAVNEDGNIVYATADTVYLKSNDGPLTWESRGNEVTGYATTKMSLDYGQGYDMNNDGLWWHEQVALLMEDIVANQGITDYDLDNGNFDEDGDDVVAGVTISVTGYLEAIENAIARGTE